MAIFRPKPRKIMASIVTSMQEIRSTTPKGVDFVAIFMHPSAVEELKMDVRLSRHAPIEGLGVNRVFGMTIEESETEPSDPGYSILWYERPR
jgi:hypothetical protein